MSESTSTAVLYYSKHGATRAVAEQVARKSGADLTEIGRGADVPEADRFVVGLPIYAGTVPRPAVAWLERARERLLGSTVYLFVSCLSEGSKAESQLADGVPAWLVAHSSGTYFVGGQIHLEGLGFLERLIIRKVGGVTDDVDRLNEDAISELVAAIRG